MAGSRGALAWPRRLPGIVVVVIAVGVGAVATVAAAGLGFKIEVVEGNGGGADNGQEDEAIGQDGND